MSKILHIIRGVPGAGKSTLAYKLTDNVVEADQFMMVNGEYKWSPNKLHYAHSRCKRTVEDYMIEGRDVIAVANTFIKRKEVQPYLDLAKEYGYTVKQHVCKGNYKSVHDVPTETIEKMKNNFQEIDLEESWQPLMEGIEDVKKLFPKIPEKTFNNAINLDPTYKGGDQVGKYAKWILRLIQNNIKNVEARSNYLEFMKKNPNGLNPKTGKPIQAPTPLPDIKDEDVYKLTNSLKQYEAIKKEIGKPIDAFKTLPELDEAIAEVKNRGIPTEEIAIKRYNIFKRAELKGLKKIFENNRWVIGIPETKESSKMFGEETSWCTTSEQGYYEKYTKDGPLYINLDKDTGELFQFHFESKQFMDEHDYSISVSGLFNTDDEFKNFYMTKVLNIKKMLEDPKKVAKDYFNYLKNPTFDDKMMYGQVNIDDLDYVYKNDSYRNGLGLKFIVSVLDGDFNDNWWYDYSPRDMEHYSENWKTVISPLNISWNDIIKICADGDDADVDMTSEQISIIYNAMQDFDTDYGYDMLQSFNNCYMIGSQNACEKDIIDELKHNLPLNDTKPIEYEKLNIAIPLSDVEKMIPEIMFADSYDDEGNDFLCVWRYVVRRYDSTFCIYEPRYGWSGFDSVSWKNNLSTMAQKIKDGFNKLSKQTSEKTMDNNISEVLRIAGVKLDENVADKFNWNEIKKDVIYQCLKGGELENIIFEDELMTLLDEPKYQVMKDHIMKSLDVDEGWLYTEFLKNYNTTKEMNTFMNFVLSSQFERTKNELIEEFNADSKIYRMVVSDDSSDIVLETIRKDGTGNCWAKQEENANAYSGWSAKNVYVMVGEATLENVDWAESIYLRMCADYENEIRLKPNAPVFIHQVKVYEYESASNNEIQNQHIINVNGMANVGSKWIYDATPWNITEAEGGYYFAATCVDFDDGNEVQYLTKFDEYSDNEYSIQDEYYDDGTITIISKNQFMDMVKSRNLPTDVEYYAYNKDADVVFAYDVEGIHWFYTRSGQI